MPIALYMDEHVPRAITTELLKRGIDVVTVQEDGRPGVDDASVMDRATELGRALFTQDDDLLTEATRRQREDYSFSGVIYAHQRRVTIGGCVEDLAVIAGAGEPEDLANSVEFLPLR